MVASFQSSSSNNSAPVNIVEQAHGTWLISFADLLVLLLCTFIMYFSQTFGPNGKLHSQTETAKASTPQVGTQVATTPTVDSDNQLLFYTNDVSQTTGFLTEDRINLVKKVVDLGFYSGEWVSVSLCSGAFSEMMASNFLTLLTIGCPRRANSGSVFWHSVFEYRSKR